MVDDREDRTKQLFMEAIELPDNERGRFLDDVCRGDSAIRAEVDALLQHADDANTNFLKSPSKQPTLLAIQPDVADSDTRFILSEGSVVGRYRIVEVLGEGAMGVVYLAEQREPVRRHVALKVIKLGMDTREVIARFEAERQALAMMDHPNVAKLFDAGTTEQGQPYFVMEHVDGTRVTDFCDQHRLTTSERLRLFIQVCQAIQHAHQKGIIHRDVKPSNVLVVEQDGQPAPKIIDFGIAKATDLRLTEKTIFTEQGQMIGTPEYMSPEQAGMTSQDIDTRSDIYSLGVLLYELLVGAMPFGPTYLRNCGFLEIQRIIRDEEPPKPSTRLSGLGPDSTRFAEKRRTDPKTLLRQLRGDLDWIIMKAMEKDRTRRYATPSALADDIGRFLNGEAVLARPPSMSYRLKKTLRRHRGVVAAATTVLFVLIAGLTFSTSMYFQAESARRQALEEKKRAEWDSYLYNIGKADTALRQYDVVEAELRLAKMPAKFHDNWEWRYLYSRLDRSIGTLRGHTAAVLSVAFSPDGTWLASASNDHTVRVWDVVNQRERLPPLRGHTAMVSCVAINPEGTIIASGSSDHTVKLWDVETGKLCRTLQGLEWGISVVAFSPDGARVAAGYQTPVREHGYVAVWNTATGEELLEGHAHEWAVNGVTFSPDGTRIVTGGEDGLVNIWDSATGRQLGKPLRCGRARIEGALTVAINPDGTRITAGTKHGIVRTWDAETRVIIHDSAVHTQHVCCVSFRADGKLLASASADKTIRLWDVATSEEVACLMGHTDDVRSIAFSPDGSWLASASLDGTIRLWDARQLDAVPTLRGHVRDYPSNVNDIAFNPDGTMLATGSRDRTVQLWNIATGEQPATLKHETEVRTVAFFPDGARLATGTKKGIVQVWDMATGDLLWHFRVREEDEEPLMAIALSPDGNRVVSLSGNEVRLWSAHTGEQLTPPMTEHENAAWDVAFSPDGTRIASASKDHTVRLWNADTGEEVRVLTGHADSVGSVAFSPDGTLIVSGSDDQTIKLWSIDTGEGVRTLEGHSDAVRCVAFSPDGRRLASGCRDHTVKLWDVETGDELITLRGHAGAISALSFSPDGNLLISADATGEVKLWSANRSGRSSAAAGGPD